VITDLNRDSSREIKEFQNFDSNFLSNQEQNTNNFGLWKLFASYEMQQSLHRASNSESQAECSHSSTETNNVYSNYHGYRQVLLKGHQQPIGQLVVSSRDSYMITAETTLENGIFIVWDLRQGSRIATVRPYDDMFVSVHINRAETQIVTVGYDQKHRYQVIVWDLGQILEVQNTNGKSNSSGLNGGGNNSNHVVVNSLDNQFQSCIIARQISDFTVRKIFFYPFDESQLVSCGRENIRIWRIKKKHLPSRPVALNSYARNVQYLDIAFGDLMRNAESKKETNANATNKSSLLRSANALITSNEKSRRAHRDCAFVSSNRGFILQCHLSSLQVLAVYQLYEDHVSIDCLVLGHGCCVTGGSNHILRVWPLDFEDFLLEARHEGKIVELMMRNDTNPQVVIGTAAGTLGILDLPLHR
jgi:hypothetical protein